MALFCTSYKTLEIKLKALEKKWIVLNSDYELILDSVLNMDSEEANSQYDLDTLELLTQELDILSEYKDVIEQRIINCKEQMKKWN